MRGSHIVAIEIYLIDQSGDKMLILHEGELLHTDSSTDILEHYGVKGMKWGKRLGTSAKKVANYYDHTNRMNRKIDKNVERLNSLNKEMSTRSNFRKRSKLIGDIVNTNTKIANIEYKRDKRINKKSYNNTSKSLKKKRKRVLNYVSDKQDRKLVKKVYSSRLRKAKRTYKDNKYANREKLDRFYDYNYIDRS